MPKAPRQATPFKNDRLHQAAFEGRVAAVACWLARGADVDDQRERGVTPSMRAAYVGDWDGLRALVGAGADLGLKDQGGQTAADRADLRWPGPMADWLRAATIAQSQRLTLSGCAPPSSLCRSAPSGARRI